MAGDASYPSVQLLLSGDGANGSTVLTDRSPSPKVFTSGGATLSTAQSKFGGSSIALTGSYFTTPMLAALQLGSGDFTMEGWVYLNGTPSPWYTLCSCINGSASTGWRWLIGSDRKLATISAYWNAAGPTAVTPASIVIPLGVWTHIATVRSGNTLKNYINGVADSVDTTNPGASIKDAGSALEFGRNEGNTWLANLYLDDFRLTKGVARYTANFSPPVAAYVDYAGQISGLVTDSAGAPASRVVRAYRRDTGALVASAVSNGTTGAYSINLPTLDEVDRIVLDNATSGTIYTDLIERVIPA